MQTDSIKTDRARLVSDQPTSLADLLLAIASVEGFSAILDEPDRPLVITRPLGFDFLDSFEVD